MTISDELRELALDLYRANLQPSRATFDGAVMGLTLQEQVELGHRLYDLARETGDMERALYRRLETETNRPLPASGTGRAAPEAPAISLVGKLRRGAAMAITAIVAMGAATRAGAAEVPVPELKPHPAVYAQIEPENCAPTRAAVAALHETWPAALASVRLRDGSVLQIWGTPRGDLWAAVGPWRVVLHFVLPGGREGASCVIASGRAGLPTWVADLRGRSS